LLWLPGVSYGSEQLTFLGSPGVLKRPKYFGTGLPEPEHPRSDFSNVFHPDKTAAPAAWETLTQSFHKGPANDKVGTTQSREEHDLPVVLR
jgi:hypothetical protein